MMKRLAAALLAFFIPLAAMAAEPSEKSQKSTPSPFATYEDLCHPEESPTGCLEPGLRCWDQRAFGTAKLPEQSADMFGLAAALQCTQTKDYCPKFFAESCCAVRCVDLMGRSDWEAVIPCLETCVDVSQ